MPYKLLRGIFFHSYAFYNSESIRKSFHIFVFDSHTELSVHLSHKSMLASLKLSTAYMVLHDKIIRTHGWGSSKVSHRYFRKKILILLPTNKQLFANLCRSDMSQVQIYYKVDNCLDDRAHHIYHAYSSHAFFDHSTHCTSVEVP
jgi:hypothetical protein